MKLEVKENLVEQTDATQGYDYSIDSANIGLAYKAFIQYSDPISSIVREISSNCWDSHIEAGVTKPITIEMVDTNQIAGVYGQIKFIDYGVGLSPERVEKVYVKFFTSTKRDDNSQHGAFGLGSKSPLGYADMFLVTTVSEGIQYEYIVHKGTTAPRLEKITEFPTPAKNGTTITVPIKNSVDYTKFQRAVKVQLRYFDNVEYVNCGLSDTEVKLYRGKNFIFNEDPTVSGLHLCIGKVYYPLQTNQVKLPAYMERVRLGLLFDIGDVDIVWNRENVEYSDKTIAAIEAKAEAVKQEFEQLISDMYKQVDSIEKYCQTAKETLTVGGVQINLGNFVDSQPQYPKYTKQGIRIPTRLWQDFKSSRRITGGYTSKQDYQVSQRWPKIDGPKMPIYLIKGSVNTITNQYISHLVNNAPIYLLREDKQDDDDWYRLCGIHGRTDVDKLKPEVDKLRKEINDYLATLLPVYDDVVIDPVWNKKRKAEQRAKNKKQKQIYDKNSTCFVREYYYEGYSNNVQVRNAYPKTTEIVNSTGLVIFGYQEDDRALTNMYKTLMQHKRYLVNNSRYEGSLDPTKVRVIKIAKDKEEIVRLAKYNIHVNDLVDQKGGYIFSRYATALKLREKLSKIGDFSIFNTSYLSTLLPEVVSLYDKLQTYIENHTAGSLSLPSQYQDDLFRMVFDNGLEDKDILEKYDLFLAYLEKYPMLMVLSSRAYERAEDADTIVVNYINERGKIAPQLLHRLREYKIKKHGSTKNFCDAVRKYSDINI